MWNCTYKRKLLIGYISWVFYSPTTKKWQLTVIADVWFLWLRYKYLVKRQTKKQNKQKQTKWRKWLKLTLICMGNMSITFLYNFCRLTETFPQQDILDEYRNVNEKPLEINGVWWLIVCLYGEICWKKMAGVLWLTPQWNRSVALTKHTTCSAKIDIR